MCDPPLFAVADGMGGAQAGEVAARLAASVFRDEEATGGEERLVDLIQEANRRVHQRSIEDPNAAGMGTTLTVAVVEDGVVSIGHVGDSRAYLVRDGNLEQLTEDHSLVAELMRSGKLSPEEAEQHPQRSMITRALGTDPDVDVDRFSIQPRAGDLFLICSDGLSSMVDDRTILEVVDKNRGDLDRLAKALISAANKGGGEDNITVVAFEITGEDASALDETQRMPAAREEQPDPDEEDTLDETDNVPTVDTAVISTDEIAAWRDEAQRRSPVSTLLRFLLVALVLAVVIAVAYWGLTR